MSSIRQQRKPLSNITKIYKKRNISKQYAFVQGTENEDPNIQQDGRLVIIPTRPAPTQVVNRDTTYQPGVGFDFP